MDKNQLVYRQYKLNKVYNLSLNFNGEVCGIMGAYINVVLLLLIAYIQNVNQLLVNNWCYNTNNLCQYRLEKLLTLELLWVY